MSNTIHLNSENFKEIVLNSDKPVLVDFFATWCGPCKMMAPIVDAIADEMADKAVVCKIDVDEAQDIAMQYRVASIPTFILFKNGNAVETIVGGRPKDALIDLIEENL